MVTINIENLHAEIVSKILENLYNYGAFSELDYPNLHNIILFMDKLKESIEESF